MRVSTEAVATREVELTVEPDAERICRAMRQAARRIPRYARCWVQPGKAPYRCRADVWARDHLERGAERRGPGHLPRGHRRGRPRAYEQALFDLESEEPVVLKMRVPLMPEVTLDDYTAL